MGRLLLENMLVVLDQLNQISSQIIDIELLFPELAFYKLNDFFQESGLIENVELPHFYAPESQLIIYCLKKNIDILCYFNTSFEIIR